jgi:DNA mismatch repair protein PMS2
MFSVCRTTGRDAGTGVARANNDKQFLFLNGRPVDVPKVRGRPMAASRVHACVPTPSVAACLSQFTKTVNEVWRQYEMKHKPAYVFDLRLPAGTFDINVTPDKREVFLTKVRPAGAACCSGCVVTLLPPYLCSRRRPGCWSA